MKVRKFISTIPFLTVSIESKRKRLLKDKTVIDLLRCAHLSGSWGESFETFLKSIQ